MSQPDVELLNLTFPNVANISLVTEFLATLYATGKLLLIAKIIVARTKCSKAALILVAILRLATQLAVMMSRSCHLPRFQNAFVNQDMSFKTENVSGSLIVVVSQTLALSCLTVMSNCHPIVRSNGCATTTVGRHVTHRKIQIAKHARNQKNAKSTNQIQIWGRARTRTRATADCPDRATCKLLINSFTTLVATANIISLDLLQADRPPLMSESNLKMDSPTILCSNFIRKMNLTFYI